MEWVSHFYSCSLFSKSISAWLIRCCRDLEDYAVVYFGSDIFKILRLLFVAIFSVHFFACIFFRVKEISAEDPNDVIEFYAARNVTEDVGYIFVCPI